MALEEQGNFAAAIRIRGRLPYLFPSLDWVWRGFNYLSSRRQWGFGAPQPISVQDIGAYLDLIGMLHSEDVQDFLEYVDLLDSKWLELYSKDKS